MRKEYKKIHFSCFMTNETYNWHQSSKYTLRHVALVCLFTSLPVGERSLSCGMQHNSRAASGSLSNNIIKLSSSLAVTSYSRTNWQLLGILLLTGGHVVFFWSMLDNSPQQFTSSSFCLTLTFPLFVSWLFIKGLTHPFHSQNLATDLTDPSDQSYCDTICSTVWARPMTPLLYTLHLLCIDNRYSADVHCWCFGSRLPSWCMLRNSWEMLLGFVKARG